MRSGCALQGGGGEEKVERQHEQGKLTARERLALLFDEDTFVEFGLWVKHRSPELAGREFPADGVVTGKGEVAGRAVFSFSQDFTVGGGAVGERHAAKIVEMLATAAQVWRAGGRLQRRRRRAHPGRRQRPLRLREDLLSQHAALGRGAADLGHRRPLRRRRRLLAGPHRLRHHGRQDRAHVHRRSRGDPRGDRRGHQRRGSRRRRGARGHRRQLPTSWRPTTRKRCRSSRRCSPTCRRTTWRRRRSGPSTNAWWTTRPSTGSSPTTRARPTTCAT